MLKTILPGLPNWLTLFLASLPPRFFHLPSLLSAFLTADFRFPLFLISVILLRYIWFLGYRRMFFRVSHFISPWPTKKGGACLGWAGSGRLFGSVFGVWFSLSFFFFLFSFFPSSKREKKKKGVGCLEKWERIFLIFETFLFIYSFLPHYRPLDRFT